MLVIFIVDEFQKEVDKGQVLVHLGAVLSISHVHRHLSIGLWSLISLFHVNYSFGSR